MKLSKAIIKKFGISKRAWAEQRKLSHTHKVRTSSTKKRKQVIHTARRKSYRKGRKSSKSGFGFGSALKVLMGAAGAVVYEVFVSPLIPLDGMIKNIVELVIGLVLMSMKGMPMIVRAIGGGIATINAYQLIYPLVTGNGGNSTTNGTARW